MERERSLEEGDGFSVAGARGVVDSGVTEGGATRRAS